MSAPMVDIMRKDIFLKPCYAVLLSLLLINFGMEVRSSDISSLTLKQIRLLKIIQKKNLNV